MSFLVPPQAPLRLRLERLVLTHEAALRGR
jgi:hypothetical protein